MWPFRRKVGRHELGAVPVLPPAPIALTYRAPGPRVELGFRDGSTAALAPGSAQARVFEEIASVLTRRNEVKAQPGLPKY